VLHAIAGGLWRLYPGRTLLAVLGIALGVALGTAVHIVNSSALNEFSLAVRKLAGEADLTVRAPRDGFPDTLYPQIARLPEVSAASPALELEAALPGGRETLQVVGLDPFRAYQVQPLLLGGLQQSIARLFEPDTVLLSVPAASWLGLKRGDRLRVQVGTRVLGLAVVDLLPEENYGQRLAIMDIAGAQALFQRLGRLNRIDLRLRPGVDVRQFRDQLQRIVPPGAQVSTVSDEGERSAGLSRAYRLNLDMLALVALFTGAFLVFSTQFLALLRRRGQFAFLRTLGLTAPRLFRLLILEGALLGIAGSALGVTLGWALAAYVVGHFGADLGAGYFMSITPSLHVAPSALAVFFGLGVLFAVLGAAAPAWEAARRPPALALKPGDEEEALSSLRLPWPALACAGAGLALVFVPAVHGLPLGGYAAIALLLLGTILGMPWFAGAVLHRAHLPKNPSAALAIVQLQATPRQAAVSTAAIVASFSLMVAMLIMVTSFRASLAEWLEQMLPADLYLRTARSGETATLSPEEQERIAAAPGVRGVTFTRSRALLLSRERPAVTLLARTMDADKPGSTLPLRGAVLHPAAGNPPPAWISEVTQDVFGLKVGDVLRLPIANRMESFTVAGVWRDYARQNGAIVISRDLYVALTGDRAANDAAIRIDPALRPEGVALTLRRLFPGGEGIEITGNREVRALSLAIFDRTFAITYALEIAAVLIGLFGVSASFSAQALARRREFGVLRHLGMTRGDIGRMLGFQGLVVAGLGITAGLALGWLISLILIHVINRQSFHWTMDMHAPLGALALLSAVLLAAAGATAVLSGRRAMSDEVTRAVREDW
jgi:putative ABC transport system permease protein